MCRPITLGVRLSKAEDSALIILADGLPKSLYLRLVLHQTIKDHAALLPTKILNALEAQKNLGGLV